MGGDFDWVRSLLDAGAKLEGKLRFFIGYAGWTPGQLEDEIKSRSWFVTNADVDTIMSTESEDETLWKSLITEMGEGFDYIANAPADPSMN
jgi:putative transcriptional regulator